MKYKTRVWHPFQKDLYQISWREKKFIGVLEEFGRDLRRCHERVWRGYCDYDLFSICDWFLEIMPTMLEEFRDTQHGCPVVTDKFDTKAYEEEDNSSFEENRKAWNAILDRMIFLLKEADEATCTKKNRYEDAYSKATEEFIEKYGIFGEKLLTEEEKEESKTRGSTRIYFPSDVEKYKPVSDRYIEAECELRKYQCECKDEALALFSKWFYDLWD